MYNETGGLVNIIVILMNKTKLELLIGIFSIILISYIYWFSYDAIYLLSEHWIEIEVSKEKFIVDLVTDNYNGITSLTNKEKDTVISNFSDVNLAGTNIRVMRRAVLFILHPAFTGMLLYLIYNLFKIYKKLR